MSKIRLNDHYFIAWIVVIKEKKYSIIDNKIVVDMTSKEYTKYLEEYNETHKPVLKEIRKVVKELNTLTNNKK